MKRHYVVSIQWLFAYTNAMYNVQFKERTATLWPSFQLFLCVSTVCVSAWLASISLSCLSSAGPQAAARELHGNRPRPHRILTADVTKHPNSCSHQRSVDTTHYTGKMHRQ